MIHTRECAPCARTDSGRTNRHALWLVRHGESTWNVRGLAQGHADGPELTPTGRRQAMAVARRLAAEDVSCIYSSDLRRASQTAGCIADALGLPVAHRRELRERALGVVQGFHSDAISSNQAGVVGTVVTDADAHPPGGESIRQLYRRSSRFVEKLLAELADSSATSSSPTSGEVVLVTHGGVIRVLAAWVAGLGPDDMEWPAVPNGALFRLDLSSRPLEVPAGHLDQGTLGRTMSAPSDDPTRPYEGRHP